MPSLAKLFKANGNDEEAELHLPMIVGTPIIITWHGNLYLLAAHTEDTGPLRYMQANPELIWNSEKESHG